jgi:hypothetical protein
VGLRKTIGSQKGCSPQILKFRNQATWPLTADGMSVGDNVSYRLSYTARTLLATIEGESYSTLKRH